MTLKECVSFLVHNDYLYQLNGLPYLSRKFYHDVVQKDVGITVVKRADVEVKESVVKPQKTITVTGGKVVNASTVNWELLYSQLIMDAEVPRIGYTAKGGTYQLNLSTKPGREAFKAAMLEGTKYDDLVHNVRSYYHHTQMPVKIENFFKNELWRNNFDNDGDSFAVGGALG